MAAPASIPAPAPRVNGLLLASAGAIAFSGKAVIIKLAYRHGVDAVTLLMYRMLFALPLFLALAWWGGRGRPPLTRADLGLLGALGFTGYYFASFLDFLGLQYVSASLERLILYLNPTFVLAISAVVLHARVTTRQLLALVLSYLGVLVVFGHDLSISGSHVLLGSALVLGSALSYAIYLVYSGKAVQRLGPLQVTGIASCIACVLVIGQFLILRPVSDLVVAREVIELSVLNATVCTVLPVLLVMFAIQQVGAPMVAQAGTIGPLSTIVLSIWLLDEPFTGWLVVGTVLVIAGIWMLTRQKPIR